jgi:hypothetical protein
MGLLIPAFYIEYCNQLKEKIMATTLRKKSYIDHLLDWFDALPIPSVLIYMIIFLINVLSIQIGFWMNDPETIGQFNILSFLDATWMPIGLGYIHFLRNVARRSFQEFRSQLDLPETDKEELIQRFTNLPRWPTLIISMLMFALIFFQSINSPGIYFDPVRNPFAIYPIALDGALSYIGLPLMVFFSIRLLLLVNQSYRLVEKINIFHLEPLYGLTNITFQVGLLWVVVVTYNFFAETFRPGNATIADATLIGLTVVLSILAAATFLLPLLGVHNRIQAAKQHELSRNGMRMEEMQNRLYDQIENQNYGELVGMEKGLNALFAMRDKIQRIPTWPWTPETPRNFASAVFLPLFIWLTQQVLSRFF